MLNTCKMSRIRSHVDSLLLLLKSCSLITWLGSSATKNRSVTWTCQPNVYASVSLTKRAWAHQWNATLSLGGCSTWGLASHLNTGSAGSSPGPHPLGNTRYLSYTIAVSRSEQRLKRPISSYFVLNIIFNHSQRRSLNYKSHFLFRNF